MSRRRDGVCRARYAKRMSADAPNAWLRPVDPHSRLRLLCLPWAGGGANEFRAWPAHLPPGVQVCPLLLPGRESRFREPPIRRMDALVDELVAALEAVPAPFALYGHSMGAGIALALVQELHAQGLPLPTRLIVSGRAAPGASIGRALHRLPEDEFLQEIQTRYGGIPEQLLQERELLRLFLPTLRADLELLETWAPPPPLPLPIPIHASSGDADPVVGAAGLAAWGRYSGVGLSVRQFPGGHFFLKRADRTPDPGFLAYLREILSNDL